MRPDTRTLGIAAGVFVAAGVAAFFIGWGLRSDDPGGVALPDFSAVDGELVFTPYGAVPEGEDAWDFAQTIGAEMDGSRTAASEAGVTLDDSSASLEPIGALRTGDFPADPETDPAPIDDIGMLTPYGGSGGADGRAVDDCADDPDPGCPEGVSGTILAINALPDMAAWPVLDPLEESPYAAYPECPAGEPVVGELPIGISSNRPITFTFDYWPISRHLGGDGYRGRPSPDSGLVRTFTNVTADTSETDWNAWVADDGAPLDDPRLWITECLTISDIEPGEWAGMWFWTDKYNPEIRGGAPIITFGVPDETGEVPAQRRRPTTFLGYGIDRLLIGVTAKPDQTVYAVAHPDGDGASCDLAGDSSSLRSRVDGRPSAEELLRSPIDPARLGDPMYPYLPEFSDDIVLGIDLEEGTDFQVCIYWVGTGPAFDSRPIQISEVAAIGTPEAWRPTFRLRGILNIFTGDEVSATLIDARTRWACGPTQTIDLEFQDGRTVALPRDEQILCEKDTGLTAIDRDGLILSSIARAAVPGGFENYRSASRIRLGSLRCSVAPCLLRLNDVIVVPAPSIPTEHRLCGTGFGSGCDGDVPMRSVGDLIIEVLYDGTPGNLRTEWSVGEAAPFTGSPRPLPENPQLDLSYTGHIVGGPGGSAELRFTVVADRPVDMVARVLSSDTGEEACSVGPLRRFATDTMAVRHTFTLSDLCIGEGYRIRIRSFDGDGNRADVLTRFGPTYDLDVYAPYIQIPTENRLVVTAPRDGTQYVARADNAGVVTAAEGGFMGWTYPVEDRDAAMRQGWSFFGLRGSLGSCSTFDPVGPLVVNGGSHTYTVYSGGDVTVTFQATLWRARPVGGIYGECVPGDIVDTIDFTATMTLLEFYEGFEVTSENGMMRYTVRGIRWVTAERY